MSREPPKITCERCDEEIGVGSDKHIHTPNGDSLHRSCATEGEIEEWEAYVDEMEARATAAQERAGNRHGL